MKDNLKNNPQDGGERRNDSKTAMLQLERKKIIYNLILLGSATIVVLIGVLTMAWFASNTAVKGTNMRVTVQGPNYEISCLTGGSDGLYYSNYHSKVKDTNALVWQMTSTNKMDNYGGTDAGIEPGSHGVISFWVTPKVKDLQLTFTLETVGYFSETNDGVVTMNEISNVSLKNYLNGHLLFFEDYDSPTGYYSGLIASDSNMHRSFTKSFEDEEVNTAVPVNIYWVWPKNLSNLVNAYDGANITTRPMFDTSGATYTAILDNISAYPQYYFKGSITDALSENYLKTNYATYGSLYDGADNDIGAGVEFLLLKMSVSDGSD